MLVSYNFPYLQVIVSSRTVTLAMAENSDLSRMLSAKDELDGNNYPMWAYMMHHVLVAKGFWNIVQGFDVRPGSVGADSGLVEDGAGSSTFAATVGAAGFGTSRAANCLTHS